MKYILLTGVTGFVGGALCQCLLESKDNFIYLLARGKGGVSPERRVRQLLEDSIGEDDGWSRRIRVLDGDLLLDQLGITPEDYSELLVKLDVVYHCAASIKFTLSYERAKEVNCGGTEKIVSLVNAITNPAFERLNYISTSYIAGSIVSGFAETDLVREQQFSNTYELTKCQCELFLQENIKNNVPITIFRPSIVTSSSLDGSTHKNNIIYKFIKMLQMGAIPEFYCEEDTSVNMVPIDYVVNGILSISNKSDSLGKTYHLVNRYNTNVKAAMEVVCQQFGISCPDYCSFSSMKLSGDSPLYHFFRYAQMSHHFDDEMTRAILQEEGVICERISLSYLVKNIHYCMEHGLLRKEKSSC